MWQSPLPEMIVLRKMLDDDDVDEVFFRAEIEYQKDRRLAFSAFLHTLFSHQESLFHSPEHSDNES